MLKSSSRIDSSLFHGTACDARPKARRMDFKPAFPAECCEVIQKGGHYDTRTRAAGGSLPLSVLHQALRELTDDLAGGPALAKHAGALAGGVVHELLAVGGFGGIDEVVHQDPLVGSG